MTAYIYAVSAARLITHYRTLQLHSAHTPADQQQQKTQQAVCQSQNWLTPQWVERDVINTTTANRKVIRALLSPYSHLKILSIKCPDTHSSCQNALTHTTRVKVPWHIQALNTRPASLNQTQVLLVCALDEVFGSGHRYLRPLVKEVFNPGYAANRPEVCWHCISMVSQPAQIHLPSFICPPAPLVCHILKIILSFFLIPSALQFKIPRAIQTAFSWSLATCTCTILFVFVQKNVFSFRLLFSCCCTLSPLSCKENPPQLSARL